MADQATDGRGIIERLTSAPYRTEAGPSVMALSPGEQQVWAARFALVTHGGGAAPLAIRLASRSVQQLREVDTATLQPAERAAVEQMRGGR